MVCVCALKPNRYDYIPLYGKIYDALRNTLRQLNGKEKRKKNVFGKNKTKLGVVLVRSESKIDCN